MNITFGNGIANPGPPLSTGYTDFIYTTNGCPPSGYYSVFNENKCFGTIPNGAGHLFFGAHPTLTDSDYMMVADYEASATSKIVFADTVKNLCNHNSYLFWAGIRNVSQSQCFYPNFTFSVETLSGTLIKSFQTGDIGGSIGHPDNYSAYFGYQFPDVRTTFPYYYGLSFTLPAGVTDIVVKIKTNPSAAQRCEASFVIDNILLTPLGPNINISIPGNGNAWLASTCFNGNTPFALSGKIGSGYYDFNTFDFISSSYTNPAVQWQQSVDDGYTWKDIPGETNLNLSRSFSIPDTFFVRLRASELDNINNQNCSNISNVIQVQVDGLPSDFDMTSNSPVCTDSDVVFDIYGGASYFVTGPNDFYDNTAYPHVYHPVLADSGWYYAQIISLGGCIANDSTYVQVFGPDLKISVTDSTLCYGKTTQLHSSGGNTYLWTPPDGLSNINIPAPYAKPLTTTKYQLKITDASGCSAFGSVTVKLRDSILKAQMIAPKIICPDDLALFQDTSIGKITNWYWDFGNGFKSNEQNPPAQHYLQAENNRNYPIQLVITDSAGCADTTSELVKAVNNCYIAVPSAFTPNHDGLNDYLYPLNAYKATNLLFKIYNRFGRLVFETKDWTKKWDGTIQVWLNRQGLTCGY